MRIMNQLGDLKISQWLPERFKLLVSGFRLTICTNQLAAIDLEHALNYSAKIK